MTIGLVALFSGCAMCANPYDYCGPTVTGECGCDPNAPRAGSILSGSTDVVYSEIQLSSAGSTEDRLLEELLEVPPTGLTDAPTVAPAEGWTSRGGR